MGVWHDCAETRRINVRLLIEKHGTDEVCTRLGIQPQMLSQYLGRTVTRAFGDTLIRRIEREFKLPKNWLDNLHPEERSDIQMLIDIAQSLSPRRLTLVLQLAIAMLETNAAHNRKDSDDAGEGS